MLYFNMFINIIMYIPNTFYSLLVISPFEILYIYRYSLLINHKRVSLIEKPLKMVHKICFFVIIYIF